MLAAARTRGGGSGGGGRCWLLLQPATPGSPCASRPAAAALRASSSHPGGRGGGLQASAGRCGPWRRRWGGSAGDASVAGGSVAAHAGALSAGPHFVLGIETSCDETGAAVVSPAPVSTDGTVLGEALASQVELHALWGGVVPKLAQDEHVKVIDSVVQEALAAAGVTPAELSAVAVTIGPGLSICLRVGVTKARAIAKEHQIPVINVHHMEAHALVARLSDKDVGFPFVTLLVSGGHNLLLLAHGLGRYTELGTTLDDALGEAYDKTARLLGLDLSRGGGPALESLALEGDPYSFRFTVPMKHTRSSNFSYAGLKTQVRMAIDAHAPGAESKPLSQASTEERVVRANIAASFQRVALEHLEMKTKRAVEQARDMSPSVKCLNVQVGMWKVVAGGVAANKELRRRFHQLSEEAGLRLVCPPPKLCTDNGVMVAWAGAEYLTLGAFEPPPPLDEREDFRVDLRARWPLGEKLVDDRSIRSQKKRDVYPSLTSLTILS
eukprot:SM000030S11472  [mRNA]  locus=s30:853873:858106:+ [translate_table: standard]